MTSKEDYLNAIKPHIEELKAAIINSNDRMIMVKVAYIAKEMGEDFAHKNPRALYWPLKCVLFEEGIVVDVSLHKSGCLVMMMTMKTEDDILLPNVQKCFEKRDLTNLEDLENNEEYEYIINQIYEKDDDYDELVCNCRSEWNSMETALSDISSMVTDNGYFPYIVEDMKTFTRIMSICEHKKIPRIGIYSIIDLHWVSKKNKWVWNRDIDYWFSTAGSFIYDFCADCSERKGSVACDIKIVPEEHRDETLDVQIKKADIAYDIKKGIQKILPDAFTDVQNRDEKKEISDNCGQKIDRRMNIIIELTKKEVYYLNKRNLLTSNREIGDWSGIDVEILDKLTFNKELPIIHVSFDKKKERKMNDTDKECFASLVLELNENQIRYLENNTDDWTWSKQGLSALLIKLNNIVRTSVYCPREFDETDKNDVDTGNTSEEAKCLNLEDLNDVSSVHIFPSGNAIAKYPLNKKKNLSFIADTGLINKIEDENGKWRIVKKDGVFHAVKIPDGSIDFEIPKGLDLHGKSIVFGEVGAGKSTLLSSIGNRYVHRHLNVFTIESPRGLHIIDATHLDNTEDAVDTVLLCRPDIILFDEIRNRKHFQQLKQLSLACTQIVGSFHADDIFEALTRFAALNGERSYGELSIIASRFIHVKNGKIVNWYTIRTTLSSKLSSEFFCDGDRPVTEIRDKFGNIVGWLFYFANDINVVKK